MRASLSFEILKLRKRPATWVLGGILLLNVILNYFIGYLSSSTGGTSPVVAPIQLLYPNNMVETVLTQFDLIGAAIGLILGALAAGIEYGDGTLKTVLTQRPGRVRYLAGKLAGVGVVLAVFILTMFLVGTIISYLVLLLQGVPGKAGELPIGQVLRGLGAGWLILASFSFLGFFFSILFRGAAAAIGVGLAYIVVDQTIFAAVLPRNELFQAFRKALPAINARDLINYFQGGVQVVTPFGPIEHVGSAQATLVLIAYGVVSILLVMTLFQKQDVT